MLSISATAQAFAPAAATGRRIRKRERADRGAGSIWGHASTWGLLLLLLYFALDGVSPFVNEPTATRAVATGSAGGVLVDRASKLLVFVACMGFALQRHASVRRLSMQTKLITIFPLLALLLAAIGLYGVISYSVVRRTNEIGIRLALGAQTGSVLWMVLRESLLLLAVGLAIGLPLTFATTHLVGSQLFGIQAYDPATFTTAIAVVAAMTILAAWLPARRAAKVDPMVALRCD